MCHNGLMPRRARRALPFILLVATAACGDELDNTAYCEKLASCVPDPSQREAYYEDCVAAAGGVERMGCEREVERMMACRVEHASCDPEGYLALSEECKDVDDKADMCMAD